MHVQFDSRRLFSHGVHFLSVLFGSVILKVQSVRWLTIDSHSQLVKYWHFGLVGSCQNMTSWEWESIINHLTNWTFKRRPLWAWFVTLQTVWKPILVQCSGNFSAHACVQLFWNYLRGSLAMLMPSVLQNITLTVSWPLNPELNCEKNQKKPWQKHIIKLWCMP